MQITAAVVVWMNEWNVYKVDWNIGFRRCPEKMSSLGGPTLKKKKKYLDENQLSKVVVEGFISACSFAI